MQTNAGISRRTVLKGAGVAVTLPFMESLLPKSLATPTAAARPPIRMGFFYVPNGVNMTSWFPTTEGPNYTLSTTLQPLEPFRSDFQVLGGLTLDKARANGDGAGDHARAGASFLTCAQARKTSGANFHAGPSADQIGAARLGDRTRIPSLEVGIERYRGTGNCDSGYSCVYETTLAWRNATSPVPTEVDPRIIFSRLFAARPNDPEVVRRNRLRGSVLNAVLEEANSLQTTLSGSDRQKLDQYLTNVTELEARIGRADTLPPVTLPDGTTAPRSIPSDLTAHYRLNLDLLALAFQTDVTRIGTFMLAKEGSEQQYRMVGVTGGHHSISHHQNRQENLEKLTKINTFHITQFAYLLEKLKSIPEGEGTLLDNCMLAYGSGIADGNAHAHNNIPILLAGKGGGTLTTGRFVRYPRETPVANLWLAMLERFGVSVPNFGDSTGVLRNL